MSTEITLKFGRQRSQVAIGRRTAILCDSTGHARRVAQAVADGGTLLINGADGARGSVRDQLGRRVDADRIGRVLSELHLDEAVLEWRPRDLPVVQRMLAASVIALVQDARMLAFDLAPISASPFDVAHLFSHLRRIATSFDCSVIAVVADPAFITSAGEHLVVLQGDAVVEAGPSAELLARPTSDALLQRLEATPVPSPMAMQMRRVQRVATAPVNYSHTQIIVLPTQDSVALASGDEEPTP